MVLSTLLLRFSPLSEKNVASCVCVSLYFRKFSVLRQLSGLVYGQESLWICDMLVVMDQFMSKSSENILKLTILHEKRYRIRRRIVVSGRNKRVEKVPVGIIHIHLRSWVYLNAFASVEVFYFQDIVLKSLVHC